ncbi:hypothetical protein Rhopal_003682-T1 [Rhodotorula paludigena]|uniref:Uncharacterized protein n=1 Tax=Rhodotorula paludigena TaxID=86838 RepID=A0AAV5GLD6_9BASI|nr:hypothetical protein Rhopal_003682-T1 [Rhodotorula paludigena]
MGALSSRIAAPVQAATEWAVAAATAPPTAQGDFSPDYADVPEVLRILQLDLDLPAELAVDILEAAEYWPSLSKAWTGDQIVAAGPQGHLSAQTLVVTPPLPALPGAPEHFLRRVSVWTDSKDQGFSGQPEHHGTREASSSWFELVLLRPASSRRNVAGADAPDDLSSATSPSGDSTPLSYRPILTIRLHSNIHASRTFTSYTLVLPPAHTTPSPPDLDVAPAGAIPGNSSFLPQAHALLREARAGDTLAVRACAQYPAWVNRVRGAALRVEVAVV